MTMLALAKKVYPNAGWDSAESGKPYCVNYDYFSSDCYSGFDPERNPAQLLDVLCWLSRRDEAMKLREGFVVIGERAILIDHDNTPASLAAAIVKAAVRVAGGEDESW